MNMDDLLRDAELKSQRYRNFLGNRVSGALMVNISCDYERWIEKQRAAGIIGQPNIEIPDPMTEDFLAEHAFNWGAQHVRDAQLASRFHMEELEDDFCSTICFHPGAGYQAAMSSGGDLLFFKGMGTSYTIGPVLADWDRMDAVFNHDNQWVHYAKGFWRGVDSVDARGVFVAPRFCRSPLDLANDLRGDRLFMDLYDFPDEVSAFVGKCADSIIAIDKILRADSATLRNNPGGALGVASGHQTILMNGDPLDLISDEMVLQFNNPALETVTHYAPSTYLHHHSIGIARVRAVSMVRNLTVQQLTQDPNGPRIADCISDELIDASLCTPIHLMLSANQIQGSYEAFVEKLLRGRFILDLWVSNFDEGRWFVRQARRITGQ